VITGAEVHSSEIRRERIASSDKKYVAKSCAQGNLSIPSSKIAKSIFFKGKILCVILAEFLLPIFVGSRPNAYRNGALIYVIAANIFKSFLISLILESLSHLRVSIKHVPKKGVFTPLHVHELYGPRVYIRIDSFYSSLSIRHGFAQVLC
jgi:hypothetical protein